jgi:hypothetical protein
VGVCHFLECRKGFGRYDKQRFRRIEIAYRLREVRAIDIGNEPKGHISLAIVLECFMGHDRPEIGTANADVHDVANALAGVAFPRAGPHAVRELGHLVEHGMNLRNHVLYNGSVFRRTKGHVQDRAFFRDVDLLSEKHECFVGDAVLRVIEIQAHGLDRHALTTFGIVRKQLPQVQLRGAFVV